MIYPDQLKQSKALYEQARTYLPGGNTRVTVYMDPFPIYAARGEGCRIWDVDGVERIDVINNFTSQIHGHCHPRIMEDVSKQLLKGTCFGMPTETEIKLAKLLVERIDSVDQVRFMNSGTEAVMSALKAARAYTNRPKIAKVEGAYHGSYDFAEVSLDSNPDNWGKQKPSSIPYAKGTPVGVTDDVIVIPFNNPEKAVEVIRNHAHDLAAVLIDPLPNRAGLVPATKEYIEALKKVTSEIGALLIFDEVISFRLAFKGAQSLWGVEADLTVLGKLIGGGFPIGAVGGKKEIMAVFDPTHGKAKLPQGGTFSANPISMVAGFKSVELLDKAAYKRLDDIGETVRLGVQEALKRHKVSGQVVGMGSLMKIHFTDKPISDYRSIYPNELARKKQKFFFNELINNGLLPASYGLIALSTVMEDKDVNKIISSIDKSIEIVNKNFHN